MSGAQIFGAVLVAAPFIVMARAGVYLVGWKDTAACFLLTLLVAVMIHVGMHLMVQAG